MITITQDVFKKITDIFNSRKKAIGLSGYTVREMIGQGGSANVYRLTGRAGSPDYVLRISEEQKSSYSNDIFNMREIEILQELKKDSLPHVVQYFDAFVVDIPGCPRYYCAVMKLLVPLNTYRLAGDGVEIAVRLGSDLLPLLQSFADKEIIHRDIKPENIFYDGSFRNPSGFLLGDFGIAKRDTETSVTPTGTESTVSPEVRGLDRSLSKDRSRCDMYSLGIVMYRYLNDGIYPSNRERVDKMPPDKSPFPEPRYGSKRLKKLVVKATGYYPDDRFDSPQAMLRELQQCDEYAQFIERKSIGSQPTFYPPQNPPVPGAVSRSAPYSRSRGTGVNPVPDHSARKNWLTSFLKNKALLISSISAAAVLMMVLFLVVLNHSDIVEIRGSKYHKNSERTLSFSNATISTQDAANIAQMKALTYLSFDSCIFEAGSFKKLDGIASALKTLKVKDCSGINDYSLLSSLPSLENLTISNSLLTDKQLSAVPFEKLTQLSSVDLSDNAELSDISCLKEASDTLCQMNVSGTLVKDFSVLSGGSIEIIKAQNCSLTYSSVMTLPDANVRELYLSNNNITAIPRLKKYGALTYLDLSRNKISEISPLSDCVKLTSVCLSHNSISDLSALSVCPALKDVNVSYNKLKKMDGLEKCIYLKQISAAHNKISSIDGLTNCTLLEYVDLSNNRVSDISVLSKSADKLITVLLDNNKLSNIVALQNTVRLEYISMDGNALVSLSPLSQSKALRGISASGNAIGDLDPICNAPELKYVYLSRNSITTVPHGFLNLQNLNEVDLSCNFIKSGDILHLSNSRFDLMALQGNPVTRVSGKNNSKGHRLILSYHKNIDFSLLKEGYYYYDIVDCPLDKQVEVRNSLNGIVTYVTPEEATGNITKYFRLCSAD